MIKLNWFQRFLKKIGLLRIIEIEKKVIDVREVEKVIANEVTVNYTDLGVKEHLFVTQLKSITIPKNNQGSIEIEVEMYVVDEQDKRHPVTVSSDIAKIKKNKDIYTIKFE